MLALQGLTKAVLIWIQLWPPLYADLERYGLHWTPLMIWRPAADLGTGTRRLPCRPPLTIYSRAIRRGRRRATWAISIPFHRLAASKRMENFGTAWSAACRLQAYYSGAPRPRLSAMFPWERGRCCIASDTQ